MNREVRKMWHKKEERTPEVHREYLKKLEKVKTPEDARALHKEMKKYKGGSGLPLPMRYPDTPLYISSTVAAIEIIIFIVILNLKY